LILKPDLLHTNFGTHNKWSEPSWVKQLCNLGKDLAKIWWGEEKLIGRRFPTYAESFGCAFSVDFEEVCGQKMIALNMS